MDVDILTGRAPQSILAAQGSPPSKNSNIPAWHRVPSVYPGRTSNPTASSQLEGAPAVEPSGVPCSRDSRNAGAQPAPQNQHKHKHPKKYVLQ